MSVKLVVPNKSNIFVQDWKIQLNIAANVVISTWLSRFCGNQNDKFSKMLMLFFHLMKVNGAQSLQLPYELFTIVQPTDENQKQTKKQKNKKQFAYLKKMTERCSWLNIKTDLLSVTEQKRKTSLREKYFYMVCDLKKKPMFTLELCPKWDTIHYALIHCVLIYYVLNSVMYTFSKDILSFFF